MTDTILFKKGRDIDGRYRLNEVLARGGFGVVWSARHLRTGQHVAIKVLDADRAALRDDAVDRFLREATITASLRHPNTVRLFDVGGGEEGGPLYLVMERLYGPTLEQVLESLNRAKMAMSEMAAIDLALQVLGSLSEAHEAGLVHRDLKPSNLMLNEVPGDVPVVKVLDFGCIYIQGSELTKAGNVYGTPGYMSPEQIVGDPVDRRTDLYALGVILYHCITGRGPFVAAQSMALMYQFTSKDPPDPRDVCDREISAPLAKVLLKSLARKQADRYQDAAEMRKALRAVRTASRAAGHSTRKSGRKTMISGSYSPDPGETLASLVRVTDENRLPHDRWARVPTESEPSQIGGDGGVTTAYNIDDDELAAVLDVRASRARAVMSGDVTESSPSEVASPLIENTTDREGTESRANAASDLTPEDFKESEIAYTDVYRPDFHAAHASGESAEVTSGGDAASVRTETPTTIDQSSAELRAAAATTPAQPTAAIDPTAFATTPNPIGISATPSARRADRRASSSHVAAAPIVEPTSGNGVRWVAAAAVILVLAAAGAYVAGANSGNPSSLPVAGVANGAPPPPATPPNAVAAPTPTDSAKPGAKQVADKPAEPVAQADAGSAAPPAAPSKPTAKPATRKVAPKRATRRAARRPARSKPAESKPTPTPPPAAPILKPKIFDD